MRKNLPGHGEITGNRAGSTGSENQILKGLPPESFFQKYPVDEAFMGWIETKYGSGVLQSLYTQLENGNQDRICGIGLPETVCMFCGFHVLQAATVYVVFV